MLKSSYKSRIKNKSLLKLFQNKVYNNEVNKTFFISDI